MQSTHRPPRLARWLLNHFGCSPNNEALIGDLDEQYRKRHSRRWYWKQVLVTVVVSLRNEVRNPQRLDFPAIFAAWIVFGTVFAALFPALGRCTVLVCFAGFGSGLTVGAFSSSGRFLNALVYAITVNLYWIGFGIVSSPYAPALLFYKIIFPGLSRSAQISTHTMVGNMIVLNLFIWLGAISGHPAVSRATPQREQPN